MTDDGEYRLVRFNGSSHQHVNHIEREQNETDHTFRDVCHIHVATSRYQRRDNKYIEGFANPTMSYSSFQTAFEEFFFGNGFVKPKSERQYRDLFAK